MSEFVEIEFVEIDENEKFIEIINKIVNKCFEVEKLKSLNFYLNVILTNSNHIQEINKKYRNIDKETDVLSFPIFEKEEIESFIKEGTNHPEFQEVLGDIVISIPKIQRQAIEYGHSVERELAYMIVHGFYHIMGYDHIEKKDKVIMREKEENILNILNIKRGD